MKHLPNVTVHIGGEDDPYTVMFLLDQSHVLASEAWRRRIEIDHAISALRRWGELLDALIERSAGIVASEMIRDAKIAERVEGEKP